ncbi:hypothetical protein HZ326_27487 [Fusarium oxysporum f. sp. albedinis]|nr:hypothetical protein HZ326_27487 [Fusarium oxysporum f. sp. albedinis]
MKRIAVSVICIISAVWRRGDGLRSIMSQTTFQAVLVCVGAGRPTEELQQSQAEGPVWFGKFINQLQSEVSQLFEIDDSNSVPWTEVKGSFWKCF